MKIYKGNSNKKASPRHKTQTKMCDVSRRPHYPIKTTYITHACHMTIRTITTYRREASQTSVTRLS